MTVPAHPTPARLSLAEWVATAGGLGLSPVAPGTLGSLLAIPLMWAVRPFGVPVHVAALTALTVAGTVAAGRATTGDDDPRHIVVDEVAGCAIALAFVPWEPLWVAAAFGLFRVLDIAKPGPIGVLDRRVHGGVGIMADDVAAGLVAGLALAGLRLVV